MLCAPRRTTLVLSLVSVFLLAPGCVMRHLHVRRVKPYSRRTTTAQDVVYTLEVLPALAVTALTFGLAAPFERDGTMWNNPEFWDGLFDDDDDHDLLDQVKSAGKRAKPRRPTTHRHIGRRRTR